MKRGPRLIVWENDGQGIMKEIGRIEGGSELESFMEIEADPA